MRSACCSTSGSRSAAPCRSRPRATASTVRFPEATQLAEQADVRIAGVPVGKVVATRAGPNNRTDATIEMRSRYAPVAERRARDAAGEDAARRDLRRPHAGQPQAGMLRTAARWRMRAVAPDGRARRDLPHLRRRRRAGVPDLDAVAGRGVGRAAAPTSTRSSATCPSSSRPPTTCCAELERPVERGDEDDRARPATSSTRSASATGSSRGLITESNRLFARHRARATASSPRSGRSSRASSARAG